MTAAESLTVSQLLSQIDAATSAAAAVIEGCTDDQWGTVVADENRTVGVVCHHIGYAYPFVVDWALQVARGEGAPAVSYDDVHALNHQHAEAQGTVDKEAALAQLHENTKSAREKLGELSDADLQTTAPFKLIGDREISAQQMVQWFLVNHAHNHVAEIQQTLKM